MHFALCSSCPYLPFCKAKIPSPSVTGLSYLQSSLLSSQGLRKIRIVLPACAPLPCKGHFFGGMCCWGFTGYFLLAWAQALRCWRHSSEALCGSLPRELMPWQLPCCPRDTLELQSVLFSLGAEPSMQILQGWWLLQLCAEVKLHQCCLAEGQQRLPPCQVIASHGGVPGVPHPPSLVPLNSCQCLLPGPWKPQGSACPLIHLLGAPSDYLSPEPC